MLKKCSILFVMVALLMVSCENVQNELVINEQIQNDDQVNGFDGCNYVENNIQNLLTIDEFWSEIFDEPYVDVIAKMEVLEGMSFSTSSDFYQYLFNEFEVEVTLSQSLFSITQAEYDDLETSFENIINIHGIELQNDCLKATYYKWGNLRFERCGFWDTAFTVVKATSYFIGGAAAAPATGGGSAVLGTAAAALEIGSYAADCT